MHEVSTLPGGHHPGPHSHMPTPVQFHLPAMPFATFIRLENSYASFKTRPGSIPIITLMPPPVCCPTCVLLEHFILTLTPAPRGTTEFLLFGGHCSR